MPEPLALQIEPLLETVKALGWPVVVVDGVEADDVIGTLVRLAEKRGWDSVISTGDKDLTQLVSDRVLWVNTMSNEKLSPQGVKEKFGVPPDRIIDYLALMGDAVDNVPGVDKVGPKTAAKMIEQYGSLEGVIAHAGEVKGVVGENLRKVLDWLPTGRKLLTVKTDVELPFEMESLLDKGSDDAKLSELYGKFGFRTLRDALINKEDAPEGGASAPVPRDKAKTASRVFANHCIDLRAVKHDTLLESYVLESHQRHDMDALATRYLGATGLLQYADVAGKGASMIPFDQVDIERATHSSAEDADVTLQLHGALYPRLAKDAKLKYVYGEIEIPVAGVLLTMERNGVLIDAGLLSVQSHELGQKMLELETKAHEYAGGPFNLGSPKQLCE